MIDRRPALIARCKSVDDVMAAVKLAAARNLPIAIRGGGHNVAGHAVCDGGLMIDLSLMRAVTVDAKARIATVEGGALGGDLDGASQAHGLATTGGLISETGVAGLTLSGGIGWLRAKHGLAIDNLIAADVVTANGALVRASANENPDLLWALKGGGGNFGVVVRFEFALHPIGPEVMFAGPVYALEDGPGPIRAWRDFLSRHGDFVGSLCEFSTARGEDFPEEYRGKRVYTLACVYNGDAATGEALLQPLRELGTMVADYSGRMDYCDVQKLFDTLMPPGEFRCYWKARYLTDLTDDMIDLAMQNARAAPRSTQSRLCGTSAVRRLGCRRMPRRSATGRWVGCIRWTASGPTLQTMPRILPGPGTGGRRQNALAIMAASTSTFPVMVKTAWR